MINLRQQVATERALSRGRKASAQDIHVVENPTVRKAPSLVNGSPKANHLPRHKYPLPVDL